MALAKEIMGCPLIERFSFVSSSKLYLNHSFLQTPLRNTRMVRLKKALKVPVAAVSEDLAVKSSSSSSSSLAASEKAVKKFKVRAVVTVKNKIKEDLKDTIAKHLDALTDKLGRNVVLELFSTEIDPRTKGPKKSKEAVLKDWSEKCNVRSERVNYIAEFMVDSNFGEVGAITVRNKHIREFFLEAITIEGFSSGTVHFLCNSWVQATKDDPEKRVFFSNKAYVPNNTPSGLRALREKELRNLRGDSKGMRKLCDRTYDFDTYNDLGIPDKGIDLARPTLGGSQNYPYPRRCRTGRPPTLTDTNAESRVEKPLPMYVPRDEQFEESKLNAFIEMRLRAVLHNLIPGLKAAFSADKSDFNDFSDVDGLYSDDILFNSEVQDEVSNRTTLPNLVSRIKECTQRLLKYDTPKIVSKDKFAWLRDDEFARQAIAGVNPVNIERLKVFPPVSKLDPQEYGTQDSALKEDHIAGQLNGMTVQKAIEENKLYIIDYHDIYLPFLDKINALDGRKSYATRTIFFLTPLGTLKPIAIELSSPPGAPSSRSKRVVTPPVDATTSWIWQLAKAHVCSNDAGVHQLVNHWLRTHACLEPFILGAHRQLSEMHPIMKLLEPHMRYTLDINARARQSLINADGIIESSFTPGRYCMELSSAAYKHFWRFDMEALPADLIRRGMAEPDPTQPHGLKLLVEDYPYANDGLLIWSAIETWVRTYVNHYYPNSSHICNDKELQSWYSESINVGHADLKTQTWWPTLNNTESLISILTTLIWVASAQHAALNFGQYPYGGYVPNRPPLMRRLVPQEGDPEYANFLGNPQKYFLNSLPSLLQASKFMAVVDTLSTHSPDEEYLGERRHESIWSGDEEMVKEFYGFSERIKEIEMEIERRNKDAKLRNRCGAGTMPYELLAPSSDSGVTCRGVPNSVST